MDGCSIQRRKLICKCYYASRVCNVTRSSRLIAILVWTSFTIHERAFQECGQIFTRIFNSQQQFFNEHLHYRLALRSFFLYSQIKKTGRQCHISV
jgi:hypothetical protein